MSYFDHPPAQRVLRQFTLRPDDRGHWIADETHGLIHGVFFTYDQARRFALRETEGDPARVLIEATAGVGCIDTTCAQPAALH